jgi:hypothetical protein
MKLPHITIFVADSPLGGEKRHCISVHFEILVRKLLSIFAKNPSIFAPVHSSLIKVVTAYGPVEHGLHKERLITPELLQAMMLNPLVKEKLKRMFNTFKTKINDKCKDLLSVLSSMMHLELKENLVSCLNEKVGSLRLFQMERMVVRATRDSTILTSDPSIASHVVFNKDYIDKYSYDCKEENMSHYVYSLLEVLCCQCGFFSYDEIGKHILKVSYLLKYLIYIIENDGFERYVTPNMEAEVLLSLYLSHGSSLQFITYTIRLTYIIFQNKRLMGQRQSGGHLAINKKITQ